MFYYIQKVKYCYFTTYKRCILIDTSSAGICFMSVRTDLFMCSFFSMKLFNFISTYCCSASHCSFYVWVWDWIHTVTHKPFMAKFLLFLHKLILLASGKFSRLEICLWYNHPQEEPWLFTSGQQQELWLLYATSGLLPNICAR